MTIFPSEKFLARITPRDLKGALMSPGGITLYSTVLLASLPVDTRTELAENHPS